VPGLRVPARTSSFVFKGKTDDIKKIGDLLAVKTVLEGSVQRAGNQLKVTAQLINVADGYHLWSETYVQEMTNIFTIEETIARKIVEQFKVTLAGASAPKPRSDNVEAYELVLRGKFHQEKSTEVELNQAIGYFQRALEKQPDYALAYASLADVYVVMHYRAYVSPVENTPKIRAAVAKTLELDDSLAEGHYVLATQLFFVDRDWSAAEKEFKRAIELNPGLVRAHANFSYLLASQGRSAEASSEAAIAVALDPLSLVAKYCAGMNAAWSGNSERALVIARKLLDIAPESFTNHDYMAFVLWSSGKQAEGIAELEEARRIEPAPEVLGHLGRMYGRAGRRAEAQRVLDELLTSAKQHYVPALAIANVYDGLGDIEQCNAYYVKAITEREGRTVFAKVSSDDITRANPHFPEWIKMLGLDK
jgi:serine/threonine-protein kinase